MKSFKKQTAFTLSLAIFLSLGVVAVPQTFAQQELICPTPIQMTSVQLIPCYVRELAAPTTTAMKPAQADPEPTALPELQLELPLPDETAAPAEEPAAEEPAAEEEPVAEEPMAEEPMAEEPMAEEPMAQSPSEGEDCGGY